MKTQRKNQEATLCKSNSRWKWMAGATATAAGMTASQAGAVTINLVNNYINGFSGNHLNADLTGDGHPDLTIANAAYFLNRSSVFSTLLLGGGARVDLNSVHAEFYARYTYFFATMKLGSRAAYINTQINHTSPGPSYLTGSIPIFFKDLHINNGAPTSGSLEITVTTDNIQLDSFTYTSTTPDQKANSVPDQGSSLALLAIGAGGILAFRRWRARGAVLKTNLREGAQPA
jgi:hypothetical protein